MDVLVIISFPDDREYIQSKTHAVTAAREAYDLKDPFFNDQAKLGYDSKSVDNVAN
jgi:hypothetical protein